MRDLLFRPSDGRSVLVDAYAPWCGPCKLIEPYLVGCAEKYSDRLSVIKYDVEGNNNNDLKVELLLQGVMVRGLPTLILYNGGEPVATHSGAITETGLEEWLDNNLLAKIDVTETNAIQNDGLVEEKVGESSSITGQRGFVSFASQFDDYSL
jgi:thioredoxin 1